MSEAETKPTKKSLPRKSVKVTYSNGDTNVFDSFKAATEGTGHSSSTILRFAATREADANGDRYEIIDFVPKAKKGRVIPIGDDLWSKIEAHAKESLSTPEGIVIDILRDAFTVPGEEAAA